MAGCPLLEQIFSNSFNYLGDVLKLYLSIHLDMADFLALGWC